jgi:EAL domain-containing protein (putative c-di-GMP-specific phosphodiesterase class I)
MKRFAFTPLWISLIAFLLIFVSCFVAFGSFKRYFARRELSSQAEMMLRGFREGYESARLDLAKLPPIDDLNCLDGVSDLLTRRTFDNEFVRGFGVARDGNVICRGGPAINLSASQAYRIDDVWSLLSAGRPGKPDHLVVVQRRGDLLYLAMLESLLFDFLHSAHCRDCVSYNFVVKSNPMLDVKSDDASEPSVISYTVERVLATGTHMEFTLSATQRYVDSFLIRGRFLASAIAAIIAGIFAFPLYWYLMRRTSVAFLIEEGLKHREFVPYYQPIIDSRDGSVLGAEALARWVTKAGKLIPPGQFIPFAEENHLIEPISDQLVERILVDMKRLAWQGANCFISINAAAEQITDSPFCEKLINRLAESKIPAKNLTVEITERHQFPDLDRGRLSLQRLVDAGIGIKLDDAGTGYGGFSYIQELPIETLKIDKMFIDTLRSDRGDPKRDVLFAIIEFAKTAKLRVIAEGVETRDQVASLMDAGVYAIQGDVYAHPMPAEDFVRWIQAH